MYRIFVACEQRSIRKIFLQRVYYNLKKLFEIRGLICTIYTQRNFINYADRENDFI